MRMGSGFMKGVSEDGITFRAAVESTVFECGGVV